MAEILINMVNVLFSPLLSLEPVYVIALIASFLSLVFVVANKILVNQDKLKHVKSEMKTVQKQIKKAKSKNNDKEIKKLFDKSMKLNHQQLKMVLKPMMVSMLFIFMIFPWMSFTYGDVIAPINDTSALFVKGDFENMFTVHVGTGDGSVTFVDEVTGKVYSSGDKIVLSEQEWFIEHKASKNENSAASVVFKTMKVKLPISLPIIGESVGWLGMYILMSIPSTIIFRKLLGVQ
ncbi:MAG: DUF106 domain-containing protein [Nanohaloarchaea archaeon]|nr:DUF106 domain-containing protein [Candidatus Nanohaloarchaea archaeon]